MVETRAERLNPAKKRMNMRLIASLVLALLTIGAQAQIVPNGGFEDWDSTYYTPQIQEVTPVHWTTIMANTPCWPHTVEVLPSFDSHSGLNSAWVRNTLCIDDLGNFRLNRGVMYTGETGAWPPMDAAFRCDNRPDTLGFYFKFYRDAMAGDSVLVQVWLFNYDSLTIDIPFHDRFDTIAYNVGHIDQEAPEWTHFSLPITYQKAGIPAYGKILISTVNTAADQSPLPFSSLNTTLWVDDVYLTGGDVGIMETQAKTALRLFPNPATDRLTVLRRWQPGDRWAVRNMAGQVLSVPGVPSGDRLVLDVSGLPGGVYMVELQGREGRGMRRVVVAR